jgi:uncharacterized alpha-E superfamily protein
MSRYTERAENIARLLDVTYRMSLLPREDSQQYWGAALGISGLEKKYREKYENINGQDVMRFMALDDDNFSSIRSCLRAARENAHSVRGTVTSEIWETLNATWIAMRDKSPELGSNDIGDFFDWVKYRSHLARGVVSGTMLQDEAFHFIRLGTFLERSDNTARILDVRYDDLAPKPSPDMDYYEWGALLRSVSAFEVYRKVYHDVITPSRVAELLILSDQMPRSLHSCMTAVHEILDKVGNDRSGETQRLAGKLHAALHYGVMEDIISMGLHEYLTQFLEQTSELGNRIGADFLVPVDR